MADKRISQLIERVDIANNDVLPIVAIGATTTNKVTISTIQDWMQSNLDVGVTSVGLTMPSAFQVSGSPITTSGNITVTATGTASQYIRGDGTLADFPQGGGGGGASVSYYLNGSVSQGTIGGIAYREMNKVPVLGAGTDININADGYIASFITDAGDPSLLEIPAGNWNFETYLSASSGGGSPTFYIELYKVNSGGTATLIASNSTTPESISLGTNINPYFSALAVPTTTLALTDRLALRYYVTHAGRTITLHTENSHLCQIITTFTTGLTALNGLTAQVQNFATGTSGTDFSISSSGSIHTFNLPTASATNRGLLTAADWHNFNSKQDAGNYVTTDSTQTITGTKTFNSGTFRLAANGTADAVVLRNVSGTTGSDSGATTMGFNGNDNIFVNTQSRGGFILGFNNSVSNREYTLPDASGTIALTSNLSSYLPLSGGTLTGDLTISLSTPVLTLNGSAGSAVDTIRFNSSGTTFASIISNGGSGEQRYSIGPSTGWGGYHTFYTDTTERMRITSGGNVGIGTASPLVRLQVQDSANTYVSHFSGLNQTNGIAFGTNASNVAIIQGYTRTFSATNNIAMQVDGGNLGLGTTSPSYQLQLSTDSAAKPTSALWTIASDERIKENITPYEKGLEDLMKINPVNYDYNGLGGFTKGKGGVGIIAQEIAEVLPDSVNSFKGKLHEEDEEETEILNFNGHELIYVLINSVKELKAEIESLKSQING